MRRGEHEEVAWWKGGGMVLCQKQHFDEGGLEAKDIALGPICENPQLEITHQSAL